MNPPTRLLDLRSALVGLGLAAALVALTSLAPHAPPVKTARISLDPEAASIVRISSAHDYTVPAKQRLVLKAVGGSDLGPFGDGIQTDIKINGQVVLGTSTGKAGLQTLEFPLVAQAGDVISVEETRPSGAVPFVTGYLSE